MCGLKFDSLHPGVQIIDQLLGVFVTGEQYNAPPQSQKILNTGLNGFFLIEFMFDDVNICYQVNVSFGDLYDFFGQFGF